MKRFSAWLGMGILALLLAMTLVFIFKDRIIGPYVERLIIQEIESNLGVVIEIDRVGGTFLTTLELSGVRTVEVRPESQITELSLRQGKARYWLPDLFSSGFFHLLADAKITLDGAHLAIDRNRRLPPVEKIEEVPVALPSPAAFPDLLVRDSLFQLRTEEFELLFEGLHANLQVEERPTGRVHLELQAEAATVDHPRISRQTGPLTGSSDYDRERLILENLHYRGEPLVHRAVLDLREQQRHVFTLDSTLRVFNGEVELHAERRDSFLEARIRAENLELAGFSEFLNIAELPEFAGELKLFTEISVDTANPAGTLNGELDLHLLDGSIRAIPADMVRLQATAANGDLLIRSLEVLLSDNTLLIDGVSVPAATLFEQQWSQLLEVSSGTFSLQAHDIPALLEIADREFIFREPRVPLHYLGLQGRIGDRALVITQGVLETETGLVQVGPSRLDLPPAATWQEALLQASLTFDIPHLSEVGSLFGQPELHGGLTGEVVVTGTIGEPEGRITATGEQIIFRETPLGDLQLLASANQETIQMQTVTMERAEDRLNGSGTFRFKDRFLENMAVEIELEEVNYYRDLLPLDQELTGGLSAKLTGTGPLEQPDLDLAATMQNLNIADLIIHEAVVKLRSRNRTIAMEQVELSSDYGSLTLSGRVTRGPEDRRFEASLATLALATPDGGELELVRPTTLIYDAAGEYTARDLLLRGNIGGIHLDGTLSRRPDSKLTVNLTGLTSRYWLPLFFDNHLSFEGLDSLIIFQGTPREPRIQTKGRVDALRFRNGPFPVSGSFDLGFVPGELVIHEFAWQGEDELAINLTGTLPLDPWQEPVFTPGPLSLTGVFAIPDLEVVRNLTYPEMIMEGAMGGDIRLTGTWDDPAGHLQIHGWEVRVRHPNWPAPYHSFELNADLLVQGDEFQLQVLRLTSPEIDFTADGKWSRGPALRNLLRGRDLHLMGDLDMRGMLSISDIGWLARGIEPIRRLGGGLRVDLAMAGPAEDPEIKGTLHLTDGELRTTLNIPPLEAVDIQAELMAHHISLLAAQGQLGGAPFTLSGDIFRDLEFGPVFALDLQGSNVLLFRDEWTVLRADSNIAIDGPWRQLAVSGRLAVTDGLYRKNIAYMDILRPTDRPRAVEGVQLFSIRQEPLRSMTFDVEIVPKEVFRIENNLISGTIRPDLTLTGTGELPVLVGAVYVDEIRVRLPTTRLEVEAGLLQFSEARPNRPSIDLLANTRMIGYDINIQIEGTLAEPVVILSSIPPLPQDDLLLLLLAGRLPQNGIGRELTRAGGYNIAMYVGRGLLADWFFDDAGEEAILERLQIEIGRGITRQGRETLDARLAVAEDVMSRDDALYITAERDIYDDFNVGLKIIFRFR